MNGTPVLEYRDASKAFGGAVAVRGLRLSVMPGEIYGLIGPNGSGKTTTVKMAVGLYRPASGSVLVSGIDVTESPTKAKARIGYIPDDPAAYERLTGHEFLQFVGELFGMERVSRDARIGALLDVYRLGQAADAPFGSYSRGTRQKISILAALLHEPDLLLIDEPMVGLDPESARITIGLFRDFVQDGRRAIVLSTHSMPVAQEICARFGVLKDGALIAEGTGAELARRVGKTAASTSGSSGPVLESTNPAGSLEATYLALTGAASAATGDAE